VGVLALENHIIKRCSMWQIQLFNGGETALPNSFFRIFHRHREERRHHEKVKLI
jgi:hypothetical protein